MACILMVMENSPFPIRSNGISIRMNPVLRYLADRHNVDLLAVNDRRAHARERANEARKICRNVFEFHGKIYPKYRRRLDLISSFFTPYRAPYELSKVWSIDLAKEVGKLTDLYGYDAVLWIGLSDAILIYIKLFAPRSQRQILDWIDSVSLHIHRIANNESGMKKHLLNSRAERMKKWELYLNNRVDSVIYITRYDANFANRESMDNIHIIPNGIFDDIPDDIRSMYIDKSSNKELVLGFLGNMGYGPNIEAALRLHNKIFKPLLAEYPDLKLKIIGKCPDQRIVNLSSDNVEVTSDVDSIWPYIFSVDIFVFPMLSGAGLQNKLLETMHGSKPVVTTEICASGLDAAGHHSLLIANTDSEIINVLKDLIEKPALREEFSIAGREYVKRFDWKVILPIYESVALGSTF